jgi:excisionase family DNA binding protein
MSDDVLLTTPQVADRLGVTVRRVLALIHAGRLPSQQFGRDHVIKESDLALVAERKNGRPSSKKAQSYVTGADTAAGQASASPAIEADAPVKPSKKAEKKRVK